MDNETIFLNDTSFNTTSHNDMFPNATSPPPTVVRVPMEYFDRARYVYFYGLAVILPIGIICNCICFVVFMTSRTMRRSTTGHYLIALAVADTTFLLGELLRWLNSFDDSGQILGIDFMETIIFWCRFTFYLRYVGKVASAWVTVAIAVERFITITYPLKVATISTPLVAKIVIMLTFLLSSGVSSFPLWMLHMIPIESKNTTYCGYLTEDKDEFDAWNTAILRVGSLILPSVILFIFTILIICALQKSSARRKKQMEGQGKKGRARNLEGQLTLMLLGVAIAFLLLRLPYTISYYINDNKSRIWNPLDPWHGYYIYFANKICDLIAISNYAVNLFLYCLCGSAFRARFTRCGRNKRYKFTGSSTQSSKLSTSLHSSSVSNRM